MHPLCEYVFSLVIFSSSFFWLFTKASRLQFVHWEIFWHRLSFSFTHTLSLSMSLFILVALPACQMFIYMCVCVCMPKTFQCCILTYTTVEISIKLIFSFGNWYYILQHTVIAIENTQRLKEGM